MKILRAAEDYLEAMLMMQKRHGYIRSIDIAEFLGVTKPSVTYTRNTLDLSAVPMLHELSHLPVVVDPSHATGLARLVTPMALAATAGGADGIMVEVHNDPIHALCDGAQSLTPSQFAELSAKVMKVREAVSQ